MTANRSATPRETRRDSGAAAGIAKPPSRPLVRPVIARGPRGIIHGHVIEAIDVMRHDLAYPWTPKSLAEAVHLSRAQLMRSFTTVLGVGPITYLKRLRVERMAELLLSTDLTIAGVSTAVGWDDPSFAGRQFRARYATTPTEYRRRHAIPPPGP